MSKRRQNGEGCIYQRENGLWVCELTIGYNSDGDRERKTISSMNLEKLKKKINDQKYNLDRGILTDSNNYTVNQWMEKYFELYVINKVKTTTYDNYYYAWEKHIKDSIGVFKLDKVTPTTVQSFINNMGEKQYALSTIKKPYIVLNRCFKKAVINHLVYFNPCNNIEFPKKEPKKVMAMTTAEQIEFEEYCPDTTFGRLFLFGLNTGMRFGEMLALTWDDVDFDKKTINVNKTLVSVVDRESETKKTKIEISGTKTSSGTRIIPMSKKALEVLQKQKELDTIFCFASKNGNVLYHRNVKRALKELLDKTEIKTNVTMHVLRHSFATRLLEKGANIKALSEILGHKSINITLDIYSHALADFKSDTISLLD